MTEEWTTYEGADLVRDVKLALERDRQRVVRQARRDLDAEEATDGMDAAEVGTFRYEAELPDDDTAWSIEGLLPEDGRALLAGFRKAGKTLMALNLAAAWADPHDGRFLDQFACQPLTTHANVGWLNLELTRKQGRRWIKNLDIPAESAERIVGIHVRGRVSAYAPTSVHGRQALVEVLTAHRVERLIVDPVAPLMAACGLNIADPRDTQLFLNAMDRICRDSGVREVVYLTHVGKSDSKADDGNETAIGAERWESAVDAIWTMGRVKDSIERWFRAEGRDVEVAETNLIIDEATGRLRLDASSEGKGRKAARQDVLVDRVVEIVAENPGINMGSLRGHTLMGGKGGESSSAIAEAVRRGLVRQENGPRNSICHFPVDLGFHAEEPA